jgi:hypothetical protein
VRARVCVSVSLWVGAHRLNESADPLCCRTPVTTLSVLAAGCIVRVDRVTMTMVRRPSMTRRPVEGEAWTDRAPVL